METNNFCTNPVKQWASINCVRLASVQKFGTFIIRLQAKLTHCSSIFTIQLKKELPWMFIWCPIGAVAKRCYVKKGVLKNFAKLTEKHLYQSLFFNKGLRPATLLKRGSGTGVLLWILRNF